MRGDSLVEQQRVLHLAGITHHTVVPDDHLLADVGIVTNLAIASDNGRAFDHRPVLDDRAFADEDPLTNKGDALAVVVQPGPEINTEIRLDLPQRIPGILAPIEDRRVGGLGQIE